MLKPGDFVGKLALDEIFSKVLGQEKAAGRTNASQNTD
jgi:hypothetical protein